MPVALIVALSASCTPRPTGEAGEAASPDTTTTASATDRAGGGLTLRLVKLNVSPIDRHRVRSQRFADAAEAVRRSIEDLYRAAFVEPERWDEGEYPRLLSHFSAAARERARRHLHVLTLGPAAAEIDTVEPARAIVKLEFLLDRHERPVVAFADTEFDATAITGDDGSPIAHRAHYVLRRQNGAWRVVSYKVRGRIPRPEQDRIQTGEVAFAPGVPSADPLHLLVIGSDARPGQSILRTRADSIHIVSVDPRTGRGAVLGIPRDSWVAIPGWGSDKINAALVRGGPPLLVDTVERLSGVRIDSYVLTGFHGFEAMVDAIGGIPVDIPYPIHDVLAKARLRAGRHRLDGEDALAFSRARHDVPGGDFGRSFNQGRVLLEALALLRDQTSRGPAALLPWMIAGARHIHTDLGLGDLFGLALAATTVEPSRVRNAVASGHTGTIAGKSVVMLDARARAAFRDLARNGILGG